MALEEEADDAAAETKGPAAREAREAARASKEIDRKTKLVAKLREEKERLAKKVKKNREALQAAEVDLVETQKSAKTRKADNAEAQVQTAASSRTAANRLVRKAKARLDDLDASLKFAKEKKVQAEEHLAKCAEKLKLAGKRCDDLKENGVALPDEKDVENLATVAADYGAVEEPAGEGAPKAKKPRASPAVAAVRGLMYATKSHERAERLLEKAKANLEHKETQQHAADEKLLKAKETKNVAEERKREADANLKLIAPRRLARAMKKAGPAAKLKAKVKTRGKIKAKPAKR